MSEAEQPLITEQIPRAKQERTPAQLVALAKAREKAQELRRAQVEAKIRLDEEDARRAAESKQPPPPPPPPEEEEEVVVERHTAPKRKKKKKIIIVQSESSDSEIEVKMPRRSRPTRERREFGEGGIDPQFAAAYRAMFNL